MWRDRQQRERLSPEAVPRLLLCKSPSLFKMIEKTTGAAEERRAALQLPHVAEQEHAVRTADVSDVATAMAAPGAAIRDTEEQRFALQQELLRAQ